MKTASNKTKQVNKVRAAPKPKAIAAAMPSQRSNRISSEHVVANREFVGTVTDIGAAFQLIGESQGFPGYDVNPGNSKLFPWLSVVARGYEKYRFDQLVLEVVARNPTTWPGSVYIAFDYDWNDEPATTAASLMANHGAVSGDVWSPHTLRVDVARMNEGIPWRYVASLPRATQSQRLVYGGYFMLGLAGASNLTSFDLFIEYRVKLALPCIHEAFNEATTFFNSEVDVPSTGTPLPIPEVSGVDVVKAGQNGVPGFSGFPFGTNAIRLPGSSAGALSMRYYIDGADGSGDVAPSATLGHNSFYFNLYDSLGILVKSFLAPSSDDRALLSMVRQSSPADDTAAWSTPGAGAQYLVSYTVEGLRRVFPSATYLVPMLASAMAGFKAKPTSSVLGRFEL